MTALRTRVLRIRVVGTTEAVLGRAGGIRRASWADEGGAGRRRIASVESENGNRRKVLECGDAGMDADLWKGN